MPADGYTKGNIDIYMLIHVTGGKATCVRVHLPYGPALLLGGGFTLRLPPPDSKVNWVLHVSGSERASAASWLKVAAAKI
eukprot:7662201-Pyramimonas_sp.AAC.1